MKKADAVDETPSQALKVEVSPATIVKRSFNLPQDAVEALTTLATDHCVSATDAVRRAISINKVLHDELKNGGKIFVEFDDPTKPKKQLVIIA